MTIEDVVQLLLQAGKWSSRQNHISKVSSVDVFFRPGQVRFHLDFVSPDGELFGQTLVFDESVFKNEVAGNGKYPQFVKRA